MFIISTFFGSLKYIDEFLRILQAFLLRFKVVCANISNLELNMRNGNDNSPSSSSFIYWTKLSPPSGTSKSKQSSPTSTSKIKLSLPSGTSNIKLSPHSGTSNSKLSPPSGTSRSKPSPPARTIKSKQYKWELCFCFYPT